MRAPRAAFEERPTMITLRSMFRAIAALAFASLPLGAQGFAADACGMDGKLRKESRAASLYPSQVEERYGEPIASREWMTVMGALEQDIGGVFGQIATGGSADYKRIEAAFRQSLTTMLTGLPEALAVPLSQRAAKLQPLEINQFMPSMSGAGRWRILQTRANGVGMFVDGLAQDEVESLCWAGRSVSRVLNGVNFETLPGALATITNLHREWERYRWNGPLQLFHELALNRGLRAVVGPKGDARFNPPSFDLIALHPFAGIEVARNGGSIRHVESLAIEMGGGTIWFADWTQFVSASFVLAYDDAGRRGIGPLVRVSKYATAGFVVRDDVAGKSRTTLLLTVDALRVLNSDASAKASM
jgi:hypothetical protein